MIPVTLGYEWQEMIPLALCKKEMMPLVLWLLLATDASCTLATAGKR